MLIALSRKSHRCGTRAPDTVPAFQRPVTSTGQLISPLEKLTGGHFILSCITHPLAPVMHRLPPSEAAHVEPGLLDMNVTMLFPRLPWETAKPLQFGMQPGSASTWPLQLGRASQAQLTLIQLSWEASRVTKPDQLCLLGWKLVGQNSV